MREGMLDKGGEVTKGTIVRAPVKESIREDVDWTKLNWETKRGEMTFKKGKRGEVTSKKDKRGEVIRPTIVCVAVKETIREDVDWTRLNWETKRGEMTLKKAKRGEVTSKKDKKGEVIRPTIVCVAVKETIREDVDLIRENWETKRGEVTLKKRKRGGMTFKKDKREEITLERGEMTLKFSVKESIRADVDLMRQNWQTKRGEVTLMRGKRGEITLKKRKDPTESWAMMKQEYFLVDVHSIWRTFTLETFTFPKRGEMIIK